LPHRLLCVTAHPDDESGGFGGALLMAHQAGIATTVLCFTDGEAAHFRGDAAAEADLGQLRRAEMAGACELLGVTRWEILDYPDGKLAGQNFQQLVGTVVERIRRERPQVVLTFGGDGGVNLHRDHAMVSVVTTIAFHGAGRPEMFPEQIASGLAPYAPQKLYYSSPPFVSVRDRPELESSPTVPWSLRLDLGELADRKLEAFRKHHTQQGVLQRVGEKIRHGMRFEGYLLAARVGMAPVTEDAGMFAGIGNGEE
jgi:LmbE family N-acetylglucosaminyl deacetylase